MNSRGTGDEMPVGQGEKGEGEFWRTGVPLSTSFSGDSTSLSPILMSVLILRARGGRFEGERALGESGRGRFFALWGSTGGAVTAKIGTLLGTVRCTQA